MECFFENYKYTIEALTGFLTCIAICLSLYLSFKKKIRFKISNFTTSGLSTVDIHQNNEYKLDWGKFLFEVENFMEHTLIPEEIYLTFYTKKKDVMNNTCVLGEMPLSWLCEKHERVPPLSKKELHCFLKQEYHIERLKGQTYKLELIVKTNFGTKKMKITKNMTNRVMNLIDTKKKHSKNSKIEV